MKKLLFIVLFLGMCAPVKAQVASPSLDPTLNSELPSTSAFRFSSTIAAGIASGTGGSEDTGNESDQKSSASSALLAWKGELFSLEGVYNGMDMAMEGKGSQAGVKMDFDANFMMIYLSYLLGDWVGLGLGQVNNTSSFKVTATGFEQVADITHSSLILSATLRLAESIFLSAGVSSATEKAEQTIVSGGTTTLDPVEISYTETVAGIGFLTGDPGGFQFKLEGSITSSPEVIEETTATKWGMVSPKSSTTAGILEIKYNSIFLHASSTTKTDAKVDAVDSDLDANEEITSTTIIGLGYAPEAGLTYNLYVENETETDKASSGDTATTTTMYSAGIGYNF